jgi:sulfotransferase family protein
MEAGAGETRQPTAPLVFVGGTGRSGTHVIGKLLGRSADLALIPLECRFHAEPRGFPGLLDGTVSKRRFLRRMRGFWWRGLQGTRVRGLHKFVERDRFDAALAAFSERFESDPEGACRRLFWELLWFRAERKGAAGIVEQSTDVVAAGAVLARLFPEARFVHAVRDGRDASASRVAQTRGLIYPRTRRQGIAWWEARMERIAAGAAAIPRERLLEVSIDELVATKGPKALRPLAEFAGVATGYRVRRYYKSRINAERANQGRWRRDLSVCDASELDGLYADALDRLEAAGSTAIPLLRRSLERSRAANPESVSPQPYVVPPARASDEVAVQASDPAATPASQPAGNVAAGEAPGGVTR